MLQTCYVLHDAVKLAVATAPLHVGVLKRTIAVLTNQK